MYGRASFRRSNSAPTASKFKHGWPKHWSHGFALKWLGTLAHDEAPNRGESHGCFVRYTIREPSGRPDSRKCLRNSSCGRAARTVENVECTGDLPPSRNRATHALFLHAGLTSDAFWRFTSLTSPRSHAGHTNEKGPGIAAGLSFSFDLERWPLEKAMPAHAAHWPPPTRSHAAACESVFGSSATMA